MLKCKPIHEWTSRDVQLRIDDYQRELRANNRLMGAAQLKTHITTVMLEESRTTSGVVTGLTYSDPACSPPFSLQTQHSAPHPMHPPSVSAAFHTEIQHDSSNVPVSAVEQHVQQSEDRLLTRMVDIFQEMMGKMQQHNTSRPTRGKQFQRTQREKRTNEVHCKVCNDSNHTTISHCMSDRLCFTCLAPDHTKVNCPANRSSHTRFEGN